MDPSDAANIKDMFKRYDTDEDGTISRAELESLIQFLSPGCDDDLDDIFAEIDTNSNGVINYDEFVDWLMEDNAMLTRNLENQTRGGSLIIIGGGRTPEAAILRFMELAGGYDAAKLVVIPTGKATADTRPAESFIDGVVSGAASVKVLHTRDREMANSEEFIAPLQEATGVWIGGGNQWRLSDAYLGTAVEAGIYGVLERGGVVMGSSAGAAIQSRVMIAGSQDKAIRLGRDPDADWPPLGFDLFRWTVVDQHFSARGRKARLAAKLKEHSGQVMNGLDLVGYGIDEHTALVLPAGSATREVIGEGTVTVLAFTPDDEGSRTIKERVLRPEDGVIDASTILDELAVGQEDAAGEEEPQNYRDTYWETLRTGDVLVGAQIKPGECPPWTGDEESYLKSLIDLEFDLGPPEGAVYFQLLDGNVHVYGECEEYWGSGPDTGQTENENTWEILLKERD